MNHPTVSYCDEQAQAELILAGRACSRIEQKRHLDRAGVFAHCSEEGRRNAEFNGISDFGGHCCILPFRQGMEIVMRGRLSANTGSSKTNSLAV